MANIDIESPGADEAALEAALRALVPNGHPGYVAGRWYVATPWVTVAAGSAAAANSVRLSPFVLTQPITVSDLGARITTGASGGNAQLAIYASDATTKLPTGSPLAATGDISTTSTGVVSADIAGANVTLQPGVYWSALILDGTAGSTAVFQATVGGALIASALIGSTTQANIVGSATVANLILTFAHTFGTWPDLTGQSFVEAAGASFALLHLKAA